MPECCSVEWTAPCATEANRTCWINCNNEPNCENVYHVVTGSGCASTAILDGFTVRGGYADPLYIFDRNRSTGAGMFNSAGSPTVLGCRFVDNIARWVGGGVGNVNGSNPTFRDCEFVGNQTGVGAADSNWGIRSGRGGAVYVEQGSTTLERCVVRANTSVNGGGLSIRLGNAVTVIGCTFEENLAVDDPASAYGGGGAIHLYGGNLQIDSTTFSRNRAEPVVTNGNGGGILIFNGTATSEASLSDCIFDHNEAYSGGAMRSDLYHTTFTRCTFLQNTATSDSGALATNNTILTYCTFIGNQAPYAGAGTIGGLFTDCLFSGNSASGEGGALLLGDGTQSEFINCTFSGNSAGSGGAVYNINGSPIFHNCVLWGNTVTNGSEISMFRQDVQGLPPCTITLSYSDLQGGAPAVHDEGGGCTVALGPGMIDAPPNFIDSDGLDFIVGTADDNLRLGFGSPCIDAGDNDPVTLATDLDGNARLFDDTGTPDTGHGTAPIVDMGAYEVTEEFPVAFVEDPNGLSKSRFISISIPSPATATVVNTAIRVKFRSLHHVVPPYTGGASVAFALFEGRSQYVGAPVLYKESGSSPPSTDFYASVLQCEPHYQDWSTVSLLHVTGEAIVPSSSYEIENLAASCMGKETRCGAVSAPLAASTTRWADVATPYQDPLGAPSQPDFGDISAMKNKFASALGAPIKARSLLSGDVGTRGLIDISAEVNFSDISLCVDAFQGKPYPYKPGKCTGDALKACATDADCTAQAVAGPCILCP